MKPLACARKDRATKPSTDKFGRSFRPAVVLKKDEVCSLKRHYRGVLREVIGYLDKLAANDPQRFVFATVPDIVRHCNKFSQGRAPYQQRAVEYALAFLRKQHVISRPVKRPRLGVMYQGVIVTPHDSLALREKGCCDFKGQLGAPGAWQAEPGLPGSWWAGPGSLPAENATAMPQHADSNAGGDRAVTTTVTVSNAGADQHNAAHSAGFSAVNSAVFSAVPSAVSNQNSCGTQCGNQCGTEAPQVADDSSNYKGDEKVSPTFTENSPAPNRVNHLTVGTELTVKTENGAAQEAETSGASSKSMNDETIGQHFDAPWPQVNFVAITDGVLNTDTKQWEEFGSEGRHVLLDFCSDVIRELAAQPYLGRKTNALVMDLAMKRFNGAHGKVPTSWLKVMTTLRGAVNTDWS